MEQQDALSGPIRTLVYPSIGHVEFGRLLHKHGYDAEAIEEHGRCGYRTMSQPRFTAWLQTPFSGRLLMAHTLVISGGITEYYLRDQLWYWVRDLERIRDEIRKQLRRVLGQTVH
ncbi:MAG: hypothetical protein WAW79_08115 [Steroidobacteraceae bacterium]